mmetsp:Transcript_47438/g.119547  ORF Transcript_47438/g.119547 Transcript_47438/m.119547 type:complete len:263 (+) Transcript_47438:90-878(+)
MPGVRQVQIAGGEVLLNSTTQAWQAMMEIGSSADLKIENQGSLLEPLRLDAHLPEVLRGCLPGEAWEVFRQDVNSSFTGLNKLRSLARLYMIFGSGFMISITLGAVVGSIAISLDAYLTGGSVEFQSALMFFIPVGTIAIPVFIGWGVLDVLLSRREDSAFASLVQLCQRTSKHRLDVMFHMSLRRRNFGEDTSHFQLRFDIQAGDTQARSDVEAAATTVPVLLGASMVGGMGGGAFASCGRSGGAKESEGTHFGQRGFELV